MKLGMCRVFEFLEPSSMAQVICIRHSGHMNSASDPSPKDKEPMIAPFPIVGVGASAGGLEALSQLLGALPIDTGMAFVLIQHLEPSHKSRLTAILSRATTMPVCEVGERMRNRVQPRLCNPTQCWSWACEATLHLVPRPVQPGPYLTIDAFFESLAGTRELRSASFCPERVQMVSRASGRSRTRTA